METFLPPCFVLSNIAAGCIDNIAWYRGVDDEPMLVLGFEAGFPRFHVTVPRSEQSTMTFG